LVKVNDACIRLICLLPRLPIGSIVPPPIEEFCIWKPEYVAPMDTAYYLNTDTSEEFTNWLNFTCEVVLLCAPMVRPADVCPTQAWEEFGSVKRLSMRGWCWWGLRGTPEEGEGCG